MEAIVRRVLVFRIKSGEDLLKAIKERAEKHNVSSGFFMVIGTVKNARIAFFKGKGKYAINEFNEDLEILSCIGNISKRNGETVVHAHIVLGREDGTVIGGHLMEDSKISATGELFIFDASDLNLHRELDEETGLYLLALDE